MIIFALFVIIEKMQHTDIGKYIKNKRLKTGKSLNKFALEFDIEPAILSRIENGKQDIKLKVLYKIAEGFGMTAGELLSEFEN